MPQPKGASKIVAGPKNPTTTKTMVPYTLSKRYQDSKNRTAKSKAAALRKAKKLNSRDDGDSDSDDGDEPVSFFSHLDEPHTSSANTSTSNTYTPVASNSHSSAWSDSSSYSQPLTALKSSNPSTSTYNVTPAPQLANSAPIAPKPFRMMNPNYDPVSGIYSYGNSSDTPPDTQYQGYKEPPEVDQTGSTSSQLQAGGWEHYYHQAEQDQQLTPSAEYLEAYQEQQHEQQAYPSQQGPAKPMPGAGPGLSIDDDVVCY